MTTNTELGATSRSSVQRSLRLPQRICFIKGAESQRWGGAPPQGWEEGEISDRRAVALRDNGHLSLAKLWDISGTSLKSQTWHSAKGHRPGHRLGILHRRHTGWDELDEILLGKANSTFHSKPSWTQPTRISPLRWRDGRKHADPGVNDLIFSLSSKWGTNWCVFLTWIDCPTPAFNFPPCHDCSWQWSPAKIQEEFSYPPLFLRQVLAVLCPLSKVPRDRATPWDSLWLKAVQHGHKRLFCGSWDGAMWGGRR